VPGGRKRSPTRPRAGLLACALSLGACAFEPVVRPVELVRVDPAAQRIVRPLPSEEAAVLTVARDADGQTRHRIVRWYTRTGCSLPDDTTHVYEPLAPPLGTRDGGLALPLARKRGDASHELWLSDGRCQLSGPLGELDPDRVNVFTSAVDQRSLLAYVDRAARLFLLDAARDAEPQAVADDVSGFEVRAESGDPVRDVLWIREAGALVARELDGRARVRLGADVTTYALYDSLRPRVAYVDGRDLYEALPPSYVPLLRAEGACAPRYDAEALWLHVPCEARQLVRVPLSTGAAEATARGVFDAVTLGALEVVWVAEDGGTASYVTSPSFGRQRVAAPLQRAGLVALDETRLLGRSEAGDVVVWSLPDERMDTLFSGVDEVVVYTDALGDTTWLVHHDSDAEGLGQLSTLALSSLVVQPLALAVPPAREQGYALVRSDLLSRLPAADPLVVFREQARPLAADAARHAGTLRAALLGTRSTTLLAEDVTSFAVITEPFPGFLVSIEEGPRTGLWLAAL
jgi:hypothetical protein